MEAPDEKTVTRILVKKASERILELSERDVIIVGAGPAGLTAAYYLAKAGLKTLVLERRLGIGGGIIAGGMLLPAVVVEERAIPVLEDLGVPYEKREDHYVVDPVRFVIKAANSALDAGADIRVGIYVEDVIVRDNRVRGVVINRYPNVYGGFHVDPLMFESKYVIDATGHDANVARVLHKKLGLKELAVEGPMRTDKGEEDVIERTGEVYPGLILAGMSVATYYRTPRMGPLLGGMLLSGKKAAEIVIKKIRGSS